MNIIFNKIEICKQQKELGFYLNKTEIEEIPNEISELTHITVLDISNNRLKKIPSQIGELTNLKILDLRNNCLTELPHEIGLLKNLETLHLEGNSLIQLPIEIINLSSLKKIYLMDNPLTKPPIEVAYRGIISIKNYFESLTNSEENIKIFEAKLLIVGEGNVGKTCLRNNILNLDKDIDVGTTEGIDIKKWKINDKNNLNYRINIWDFGGQEIYHSTHQFFLTKRSMYVFVWTARTDDNLISFDYWLNIIKLLGDNPPIFVVQNKIDERVKNIDESLIKEKFDSIVGFHKISVKECTNTDLLASEIQKELKLLDHLGDTLPKVWMDIRKVLESINKEFISLKQYLIICENHRLTNKQALFLSQYYHDIGVFLHFQKNPILKKIVFLKPEWATNAVYKLIDNKKVIRNFGRFSFSELSSFWVDYPSENFIHLIELMKKFELCFNINDTNDYIIPELLSNSPISYVLPNEIILNLKYEYTFMPEGIITRLIVRLHDLVNDNMYWKSGLVIVKENTYSIIRSDKFTKSLYISISGYNKTGLLSIITREIDYIHKSLNYPEVERLIPCTCDECMKSEKPHYYKYNVLKKYQERGLTKIVCPESIESIYIKPAIQGIEGKLPVGTKQGNTLLRRLKECKYGKDSWREYEEIGTDIIEYLFNDDFVDYKASSQNTSIDKSKRTDLVIDNNFKENNSFWGKMFHEYSSKVIIIDFKNYTSELNQDDIYKMSKYLNNTVSDFGIVISRKGLNNGAKIQLINLLKDQKKLILSVKDLDLIEMINFKMKGKDPKKIINNILFSFLKLI